MDVDVCFSVYVWKRFVSVIFFRHALFCYCGFFPLKISVDIKFWMEGSGFHVWFKCFFTEVNVCWRRMFRVALAFRHVCTCVCCCGRFVSYSLLCLNFECCSVEFFGNEVHVLGNCSMCGGFFPPLFCLSFCLIWCYLFCFFCPPFYAVSCSVMRLIFDAHLFKTFFFFFFFWDILLVSKQNSCLFQSKTAKYYWILLEAVLHIALMRLDSLKYCCSRWFNENVSISVSSKLFSCSQLFFFILIH